MDANSNFPEFNSAKQEMRTSLLPQEMLFCSNRICIKKQKFCDRLQFHCDRKGLNFRNNHRGFSFTLPPTGGAVFSCFKTVESVCSRIYFSSKGKILELKSEKNRVWSEDTDTCGSVLQSLIYLFIHLVQNEWAVVGVGTGVAEDDNVASTVE